jgi:serine/threonine protein kinase
LYAAGIVLWELLTGRQLFPPGKDQPQDLVSRAKNPEVTPPSKRAPRVPVELDEICLRALSADRAVRYQTCEEMRQALQNWLAKNAPTTDISRISTFMHDLFSDDIVADRIARADMMGGLRKRAMTLPPTDEFRQLVERSAEMSIAVDPDDTDSAQGAGDDGDAPVRKPGSVGRRADDVGAQRADRRKSSPRRDGGNAALALAEDTEFEAEPNLLGTVVDNRYRVVELIGEGGMGKVYLAEHVEIGRRVALKVLHPSYGRMPDLVERFRREARAASKIGHPNIVDVTDSGTTSDGSVFFVMEHLEGIELGGIIEREGAIDVPRSLRIASQICRALAAAHNVGIIHRDLKPENVFLITRDSTADFVKVLDFGIAKTTEAEQARERKLTSPGMAMGTPEYMAPEQAAGRSADARCDVYALGAILFEMLTGVPPYQGDNFMEILTKKATVDPVAPNSLRPDLPEAVCAVVMSAMARNPDHRPQTMEAFEYELNKCLAGRGVAVAQILGMSSDATLVANLNPGLSGGAVPPSAQSYPRPVSSPAIALISPVTGPTVVARDSQTATATEIGFGSGPKPALSRSAFGSAPKPAMPAELPMMPPGSVNSGAIATDLMSVPNAASDITPSRSGIGAFLLASAVVVAAAAMAFVLVGEWRARRDKAADVGSATTITVPANTTLPQPAALQQGSGNELKQNAGSAIAVENVGSGAGSNVVIADETANANKIQNAAPKKDKDPKDLKDPKKKSSAKDLLAQLTRLGSDGKMDDAEKIYQELSQIKGYGGIAAYTYANGLFQANDYAGASRFAHKAGLLKYDHVKSSMLEADGQLRQKNYSAAKALYLSMLPRIVDTATRTSVTTKIGLCNSGLNLPAKAGINGPA